MFQVGNPSMVSRPSSFALRAHLEDRMDLVGCRPKKSLRVSLRAASDLKKSITFDADNCIRQDAYAKSLVVCMDGGDQRGGRK
jgi:hypothetical protein